MINSIMGRIISVCLVFSLLFLSACSSGSVQNSGDSEIGGISSVGGESGNDGSENTSVVSEPTTEQNQKGEIPVKENQRVIYLAGGCFWGVEGYFKKLNGVFATTTGYANGNSDDTDYHRIDETDHAETVKVEYDMSKISLEEILLHYFRIIDPKSVNQQGNDIGRQYRTGIYYENEADIPVIEKMMRFEREKHGKIAVETSKLKNFVNAEDYHQDYLDKNPGGYCHIDLGLAQKPLFETSPTLPTEEELKKTLTPEEFHIIVNAGTERPFTSELNDEYRKGIYIDKVTKVPLFASQDKFDAGCGWPSFSKPILSSVIVEKVDLSHGMTRTEVRSKDSDAHLGHVFHDGPAESGGLRYCINGASLEFVPYEEMEERGYAEYMPLCE